VTTAYLEMLIEARSELEGPTPEAWFDRLEREEDKLDAALKEACQHDPVVGLRAAPLLQRFWFARGRLGRGRQWVEQLLSAAGEGRTVDRARGLSAAAALAFRQGDTEATKTYAAEALELSRQLGARDVQIDAALTLARVGLRDGNVEAVRRFAQGARNLGLEMGDEARELSAIHCLAEGARIGGDYQLARSLYDESLARNRLRGNRLLVSVELTNLAAVEKREGNLAQAEANLREAMTISREINNSYILAANLITLAAVKFEAGKARQAARLLGHADAIYLATGLVVDPADKADYDQTLTNAHSELGEAAFAAAHADGAASSIERLIATL